MFVWPPGNCPVCPCVTTPLHKMVVRTVLRPTNVLAWRWRANQDHCVSHRGGARPFADRWKVVKFRNYIFRFYRETRDEPLICCKEYATLVRLVQVAASTESVLSAVMSALLLFYNSFGNCGWHTRPIWGQDLECGDNLQLGKNI